MKAFVIGDVHGDVNLLRGLLREAGIIDASGRRLDHDTTVIQVGDLCNCVAQSRNGDLACLDAAKLWLNVYLVGNHEHPYFGGPRFAGFWEFPEIGEKLRALDLFGLIWPCVAVDGILISHAGVVGPMNSAGLDAAGMQEKLLELWQRAPTRLPEFSAVGAARGGVGYGGIFWADAEEPKTGSFTQIVGHTPQRAGVRGERVGDHHVWYIDIGGHRYKKLAGVWINDGKIDEEPVVFAHAVLVNS